MKSDAAKEMKASLANEVAHQYPKYRWIIAVMFVFVSMIDLFFLSVISPIMTSLQETFNTSLTTIGFASTLVSAVSGLFMFIASIVTGKLNVKKSYILATILLLLGNVLCYLSTGIGLFLVGRALVGAGFGISGVLVAATAFMWFPAKERPMIFTANGLGCVSVQLIAFNIIVPLYNATGRWQSIFMLCIVLSAISLASWIFLGKDFDINTGGAPEKSADAPKVNPFDGLIQAFKSKQEWLIAIPASLTTMAYYTVVYYYPTFLSTVTGLSEAAASSVTSVLFIAGIVGMFGGGVVATAVGKRKIIVVGATIVSAVALVGLFFFQQVTLLIVAMVVFAIVQNGKTAAMQSASLEVEGMTPAMGAGASSMLFGFGSFLTLFLSPIVGSFINLFGFATGMIILCGGAGVISAVISLFMKDSGPKVQQ